MLFKNLSVLSLKMRVASELEELEADSIGQMSELYFDGVFRYKSSSMLFHLYIGWALVYG